MVIQERVWVNEPGTGKLVPRDYLVFRFDEITASELDEEFKANPGGWAEVDGDLRVVRYFK